jgi:hypothetical protein
MMIIRVLALLDRETIIRANRGESAVDNGVDNSVDAIPGRNVSPRGNWSVTATHATWFAGTPGGISDVFHVKQRTVAVQEYQVGAKQRKEARFSAALVYLRIRCG